MSAEKIDLTGSRLRPVTISVWLSSSPTESRCFMGGWVVSVQQAHGDVGLLGAALKPIGVIDDPLSVIL